jgi:hypothetical protein
MREFQSAQFFTFLSLAHDMDVKSEDTEGTGLLFVVLRFIIAVKNAAITSAFSILQIN